MTVSKKQVLQIDDYLKNKGVKYWDVRLEMIDHIVTDMESYPGKATNFDVLFRHTLQKLNWDRDLKDIHTNSWKTTSKIYRSKLWDELLYMLKHPLYILGFIFAFLMLNRLVIDHMDILKTAFVFFIVCQLLFLIVSCINIWRKKLGKSVNLDYGIFYLGFGAMMINLPINILKGSQYYYPYLLPLLICFYVIMTIAGYRVFRYSYDKVLKMKG